MEEGKGKMYTTGWTTRSLNPLVTSNDKQICQIRHFSFCFFFPSLYGRTVITRQVVVIATVRPETKLSCLARRTLALVALPRMRRLAVSTWKVN
jgi:hypothetical protein